MPKKGKSSLEDRLHRVEGQIRGIEAMLEREDDAKKVLVQLEASISSLESVKLELIKKKVKDAMEGQVLQVLDLLK